jgi:di/tricarboxylate transporter
MAKGTEILEVLGHYKVAAVKAVLTAKSDLVGRMVKESDFRVRFGAYILEIRRGRSIQRQEIAGVVLQEGDTLVLETRLDLLDELRSIPDFEHIERLATTELASVYPESDKLIELMIPTDSHLAGKTVAQSGLGESLRLRIVGIARKGGAILFPKASEVFKPGDQLLTVGGEETFAVVRAIQSLELVHDDAGKVSDEERGTNLIEVTLSPQSKLHGKTIRELDFRKRYGIEVLSVWRRGRAYRSHLQNMRLEFGDALLLSCPAENAARLAKNPDFLVISGGEREDVAQRVPGKALLAGGLMLAVVASVLIGWLPIAVAAVSGAALMVTFRCLSMEDAYRAIDWKSVFLIAGMIPLGTAMDTSGAAKWIAEGMSAIASPFGMWGMLAGLYIITALATTIVPTTALVLIMAPIAISTSSELGLDPKLLIMAVAMAASASFTSPISHPANVLVMGPGGYRFMDYVRMGVGLAVTVAITVLPLIVWIYA